MARRSCSCTVHCRRQGCKHGYGRRDEARWSDVKSSPIRRVRVNGLIHYALEYRLIASVLQRHSKNAVLSHISRHIHHVVGSKTGTAINYAGEKRAALLPVGMSRRRKFQKASLFAFPAFNARLRRRHGTIDKKKVPGIAYPGDGRRPAAPR